MIAQGVGPSVSRADTSEHREIPVIAAPSEATGLIRNTCQAFQVT